MLRTYLTIGAIAYLLGSIPFGYILVRWFRGQDIRTTGSGNIGATNVARTAPALGVLTLLLDALKGSAAVFIAAWLASRQEDLRLVGLASDPILTFAITLAALMAVLGHMFPVWLRFKGGKGVATAVGALLWFSPAAVGIVFVVFALVVAVTRYVSLGSIIGSAVFPVAIYFIEPRSRAPGTMLALSLLALFIILKHHQNIRRLFSGTESRFALKRRAAAAQLASED